MKIAFASDHAGWPLRARTLADIRALGHEVVDCGSAELVPGDDYPDRGAAVGRAVVAGQADRGIVVCGSGVGISVACNKIHGIRASMCHDTFSARQGVEDDDMNVLCLGARVIGEELASEAIKAFLTAEFSGELRHKRRLEKIGDLERKGD
jgi:ribose 5-phosphate isomerase B